MYLFERIAAYEELKHFMPVRKARKAHKGSFGDQVSQASRYSRSSGQSEPVIPVASSFVSTTGSPLSSVVGLAFVTKRPAPINFGMMISDSAVVTAHTGNNAVSIPLRSKLISVGGVQVSCLQQVVHALEGTATGESVPFSFERRMRQYN